MCAALCQGDVNGGLKARTIVDDGDAGAAVAIIGASGFVGRRLTARLAAGGGMRPIAITRRAGGMEGVEQRVCDATDAAALSAALAGASGVVNCVAGDGATLVAATRAIAAAAGGRRIVHLSSMAVYGAATGLVDETHPVASGGGWYEQAKVACEALVRGAADAVILRPGCIHGPGSAQWTGRIGRLLRQRRLGDLGAAGDGLCNLVHVDDVVGAIVAALARPGIGGRVFNVADPAPGTWNAYFMRLALAIGAEPVRRIPGWSLKAESKVLAPALKVAQLVAGRAGLSRMVPELVPPSLLALFRQEIELDHRAADMGLGFARTAPDAAIADAAAWFLAQG